MRRMWHCCTLRRAGNTDSVRTVREVVSLRPRSKLKEPNRVGNQSPHEAPKLVAERLVVDMLTFNAFKTELYEVTVVLCYLKTFWIWCGAPGPRRCVHAGTIMLVHASHPSMECMMAVPEGSLTAPAPLLSLLLYMHNLLVLSRTAAVLWREGWLGQSGGGVCTGCIGCGEGR